ncbi:MAG: PEGA domain-containing protein, partial [Candidatus Liptonbacteria bacterium]|nr:PEGA domain-containing protein [Candidatus Liptonbacteria bacterium]
MNKATQTGVLYALFGLFLLLGTGTVFYAQGYRFDTATLSVKKVGGIFIRTYPKGAAVFVDGKKVDRGIQFFNSGTLIQNLFPKSYNLSISMEGYKTWERKVEVGPALVLEANAILLPKVADIASSSKPENFSALPGGSVITKEGKHLYWGNKIISGEELVDYSLDGGEVLTRNSQGAYFLVLANLNSSEIKSQKVNPLPGGKLFFDTGANQLVTYSTSSIGTFPAGGKLSIIFTTSTKQIIQTAASSRSMIAWTVFYPKTDTSKLFVFGKFSGKTESLDTPLQGETRELKFSNNEKLATLQKNGDIYTYKWGGNEEHIASGVNQFEFSPNGDALAILKNKTLEIYFENSEYLRLNLATFPEVS